MFHFSRSLPLCRSCALVLQPALLPAHNGAGSATRRASNAREPRIEPLMGSSVHVLAAVFNWFEPLILNQNFGNRKVKISRTAASLSGFVLLHGLAARRATKRAPDQCASVAEDIGQHSRTCATAFKAPSRSNKAVR